MKRKSGKILLDAVFGRIYHCGIAKIHGKEKCEILISKYPALKKAKINLLRKGVIMIRLFNKKILSAIPALVLSFGLFNATASASEIRDVTEHQTANSYIPEQYTVLNEYNAKNFNNNEIILSQTVSENDGEVIIDTLFKIPDLGRSMYMSTNGTYTTGLVGNKRSFGYSTINGFEETAWAIVIAEFEYNPDENSVQAIYWDWDKYCPRTQSIVKNSLGPKEFHGNSLFKSKSTVTLNFSHTNNINNTYTCNLSVSCKSTGDVDGKSVDDLYN